METVIRTAPIKGEVFINKNDLIRYLNGQIKICDSWSSKAVVLGIINDLEKGEKV